MRKLIRLFFTLKDLRWQQFWFRFWHPVKRLFYRAPPLPKAELEAATAFSWSDAFVLPPPYASDPANNSFSFLNTIKTFSPAVEWNFREYGLLWTFHLNYLDCLRDESISVTERYRHLTDYVASQQNLDVGLASYPTSVRLINAIRFLGNQEKSKAVVAFLWKDACRLAAFPEWHLMANHLLENAFALFYAAYFFKNKTFYQKSKRLLIVQLKEQILPDGGHFERSPAYHLHVMMRVFQCLELAKSNPGFKDPGFIELLTEKAIQMLSWTKDFAAEIEMPHFGDSNEEMAPPLHQLYAYAAFLDIRTREVSLKESGYRKIKLSGWTVWQNVGNASPLYQPGHSHADPLSFQAFLAGKPFLTSVGVSTYEQGQQRHWERSTAAHSTPVIDQRNASDCWAAFRMGRKAKVTLLSDEPQEVIGSHDGYLKQGIVVKSTLRLNENCINIKYSIERNQQKQYTKSELNLYFHPSYKIRVENCLVFANDQHVMTIGPNLEISLSTYTQAHGFNRTQKGSCLRLLFEDRLDVYLYKKLTDGY